jgi:hypothetical protein
MHSEIEDLKRGAEMNEEEDSDELKRKRKSKIQIKSLEQELFKNPHWTNDDVE